MRLEDFNEDDDSKLEFILHVILDAIYAVVVAIAIMIASFYLIKDVTEYNTTGGPIVESIIIDKD